MIKITFQDELKGMVSDLETQVEKNGEVIQFTEPPAMHSMIQLSDWQSLYKKIKLIYEFKF